MSLRRSKIPNMYTQFSFIFFAEDAIFEMKFGNDIQVYQDNIYVKFDFGLIEQFSTELCLMDIKKFQLYAVSVHFLRRCFQGRGA